MAALAKRDAHIPFRNSKLTALLADSLSGAAKVSRAAKSLGARGLVVHPTLLLCMC